MIIVVEGIDRVGKTTLCDMIEERYRNVLDFMRFRDDTRYAHSHGDRLVNTEKINTLQNLMEAGFVDNIILDRYHITEFVYGGVERNYKNIDMFDIDERLSKMGAVILIYVVPTDVEKSSREHGVNLSRHLAWYNDFYDHITKIEKKVKVGYETLDAALTYIDSVLGINTSGETEGTGEPTEVSGEEGEVEESETK